MKRCFALEAADGNFSVVIDYVWARPAETVLAAITRPEFAVVNVATRLVQVGESAGPRISLAAAVLRSTALTILRIAGIPSRAVLVAAMQQVMDWAAKGALQIGTGTVPLAEIDQVWQRPATPGRRIVVIP